MTAFRTYVGMVVVFISLIFTLIGCTTITGINTTPVRADCPPAANGSITVNNIVISNQYNSVSTLSTSSALSSGYNINYYDATTGGSIGSGATVNNLNGNQLVKIEVVQSPYGFFTDFYQKALYNPPSVQLNNANFSTGNNISWTGTNAFGYGIFSNIVAPQSPGTIEIRGVTIGTSPTCHPSSFGFATNSSLAPSTDCYDFRVDFYPSSPCYITGFDYVILPWVKSGGSWNNLGIFGGSSSDIIQINRTMDLLSGNWQYQVTKSGSVLTSCPAPANMTLVPVAIMNENSQISFNNIGFDFCTIENPLYAELKKQLDESFYMVNEKLGIKYKSKYANDVVNYTIYDWKRNPMATGSFSSGGVLVNGYNYLQMDLSGMSLQRMNSYVLEVTDPKGEVYKLKFQYLQ